MSFTVRVPLVIGTGADPATSWSAQVKDETGTNSGSPITTGFVYLGGGTWQWTHTFADGNWSVVFSASGEDDLVSLITQDGVDDLLSTTVPGAYDSGTAGAALGKLIRGDSVVTAVFTPFTQTGAVHILTGNDYHASDSRDLNWTDGASAWPDLTGAAISLRISRTSGDTAYATFAGSVVTATGSSKKVRVQLTATNTATLTPGANYYAVQATLSSGRIVTLAHGPLSVKQKP